EAAAGHEHVPLDPCNGFADPRTQPLRLRLLPDLRHELDQKRIVVKHFLEMRHEPALVDGVARKPAADMVVDPALANVQERVLDFFDAGLELVAQAGLPEKM